MKNTVLKTCFLSALCTLNMMAANFDDNLKSILAETGYNIKIISSEELKGMNGMRLVNIEFNKDGETTQRTPFLATSDGRGAIVFSPLFFSAQKREHDSIIEKMLADIDSFNQIQKDSKLDEIFKSMPQNRFVELQSSKKDATKTTIIVSSPDCPYCREELKKIDTYLKEGNVKMVIVPLNGMDSYIKAQIITNETKKLSNTSDKIKVLNKVYAENYTIPAQQRNIDTSFVTQTAEMVFKTGLIRGVPYIHVMQN